MYDYEGALHKAVKDGYVDSIPQILSHIVITPSTQAGYVDMAITAGNKILLQLLQDERFDMTMSSFKKLVKTTEDVCLINQVVRNKKYSIHRGQWFGHITDEELLSQLIKEHPELFGKMLVNVAISRVGKQSRYMLLIHARQRPELFSAESIIFLFDCTRSVDILDVLLDKIQLTRQQIEKIIIQMVQNETPEMYHGHLRLLLQKIRPDRDLIKHKLISYFSEDVESLGMIFEYITLEHDELCGVLQECSGEVSLEAFNRILEKITENIPLDVIRAVAKASQEQLELLLENKNVRLSESELKNVLRTAKKGTKKRDLEF